MGGFLGLGNSSMKTDRGNQLAGVNADWNVYNRGLPLADKTEATGSAAVGGGLSGLDVAKQYWQKALGSRPAQMQMAAPAVSAINEQGDAKRAEDAAMGTNRGGGVAATNAGAESNRMTQTNDVLAGIQPAAAKGVADTSIAMGNAGEQQLHDALTSLGLDAATSKEIIDSSIQSRPISQAANEAVRQQWSNFLASMGL